MNSNSVNWILGNQRVSCILMKNTAAIEHQSVTNSTTKFYLEITRGWPVRFHYFFLLSLNFIYQSVKMGSFLMLAQPHTSWQDNKKHHKDHGICWLKLEVCMQHRKFHENNELCASHIHVRKTITIKPFYNYLELAL